VAEWHTRRT